MMHDINDELNSTKEETKTNKPIQLLYTGGTFGCHGTPLSPLPADVFLPILFSHVQKTNINDINSTSAVNQQLAIIDNKLIKDSSHLSKHDFFAYYQAIYKQYQQGHKKFIVIAGTDTLGYLSAFLYEALHTLDICVCLTASMKPLLDADKADFTINTSSDAWHNFQLTFTTVSSEKQGIYSCLNHQILIANSVQKIRSTSQDAFVGNIAAEDRTTYFGNFRKNCDDTADKICDKTCDDSYADNAFDSSATGSVNQNMLCCPRDLLSQANKIDNYQITPIFLYPDTVNSLVTLLHALLIQANSKKQTACIILMGFGAGNVPFSDELAQLLQTYYEQQHLIFVTSQCTFEGVNADYAAGSWLYENNVLSCGSMSKEHIFARIFWLTLLSVNSAELRERWQLALTNKTNL